MDPGRTPRHVLTLHSTDQRSQFGIDDGTASSATFPSPVSTKSLPMPSNDGVWMYCNYAIAPIGDKPREGNPEQTIGPVRTSAFHGALQHDDLLAKGKIL